MQVPEHDELYDRKNDPFQLHNLIAEKPDVAEALFRKLRTYIEDLQKQLIHCRPPRRKTGPGKELRSFSFPKTSARRQHVLYACYSGMP